MLKRLPIQLIANGAFAFVLFTLIVAIILLPMAKGIQENAAAAWLFYSDEEKELQYKLEQEQAALKEVERRILPHTDAQKKGAVYYKFLQEIFMKDGIQVIKINYGEQISMNGVAREDMSVVFFSTYPRIRMIVHDLESGPFSCAIKSLHLTSKSLIGNNLEAEMSISFYRMAQ